MNEVIPQRMDTAKLIDPILVTSFAVLSDLLDRALLESGESSPTSGGSVASCVLRAAWNSALAASGSVSGKSLMYGF